MAMEVGVLPVSGSVAFTDVIQNNYNEIIIFGSKKLLLRGGFPVKRILIIWNYRMLPS